MALQHTPEAQKKPENVVSSPSKQTQEDALKIEAKEQKASSDLTEISHWDELLEKIGEKYKAIASLIVRCYGAYSKSNNKYYIYASNEMTATMLNIEKNKQSIFDAMLLCDFDISSISQIEIISNKKTTKTTGLEEF